MIYKAVIIINTPDTLSNKDLSHLDDRLIEAVEKGTDYEVDFTYTECEAEH